MGLALLGVVCVGAVEMQRVVLLKSWVTVHPTMEE